MKRFIASLLGIVMLITQCRFGLFVEAESVVDGETLELNGE